MLTNVRKPKPDESFGLRKEQETDNTTVIEVYLDDSDLEVADKNGLISIPDPTTDGALLALVTSEINIEIGGGVSATPQFSEVHVNRVREQKFTPVTYSTSHIDGKGTSRYGTVLEIYHEDEY